MAKNTLNADLRASARRLKAAVDDAISTFGNTQDLNQASDHLTETAKHFAALITAQRIKLAFASTLDPENGKSVQSLEEKLNFARQIRDWLSPWNFGFRLPSRPEISVQLFAGSDGTSKGSYKLVPYGTHNPIGLPLSQWGEISTALNDPQLTDIGGFVYRHNFRDRGPKR